MSEKSLYQRFKEAQLIQSETVSQKPGRMRAKAMGWMWEAEMEVILTDGLRFIFYFWHHFHDDDGDEWSPSEKQLDAAWSTKFVPKTQSPTSKLTDAYWHTFYKDGHVYISKKGTFGGKRIKEEIIQEITDGSWESDPDLWMLI